MFIDEFQIERVRRQVEGTVHEQQELNNELNSQNVVVTAARNQLESEYSLLRSDISEAQAELAASEERGRRAASEAAKLSEDLRHEQETASTLERLRKNLENQAKVRVRGLNQS